MYNEVAETKIPSIMIFIDNYDVIREINPDIEEFFVKLTRDGTGIGIYTIVSASRSGAIRYSVLNNFKNKIAQFMFDDSDIIAVTGRSEYKLPEVRGRAMVKMKGVHIAQCYLPAVFDNDIDYAKEIGAIVSDIAGRNTATKAEGVRVVPDVVTYNDLIPYLKSEERQAVLGFDVESTEPMYLDFSIGSHLIVGSPSTGKTNVLKLIAKQFMTSKLFVSDSRAGDLQELEAVSNVCYMDTESMLDEFYKKLNDEVTAGKTALEASGLRAREFFATQPPTLLLIDDGDNFIELCKQKSLEVEALLPKIIESGITIITTSLPSKLKGYDSVTKALKDAQSGVALGSPGDQSIFQILSPRGYKPSSEMGFWYKRGDVRQIKIPLMDKS